MTAAFGVAEDAEDEDQGDGDRQDDAESGGHLLGSRGCLDGAGCGHRVLLEPAGPDRSSPCGPASVDVRIVGLSGRIEIGQVPDGDGIRYLKRAAPHSAGRDQTSTITLPRACPWST